MVILNIVKAILIVIGSAIGVYTFSYLAAFGWKTGTASAENAIKNKKGGSAQ